MDNSLKEERSVLGCTDYVALSHTPLDYSEIIEKVRCESAGAISSFFGTTRDNFENKSVTYLEYEAFPEMAISNLLEICTSIRKKWDVKHIALCHKLGECPIKEISVAIAISSEHRKESLEAVHFAIDELKRSVQIWKKEFYADGDSAWKKNDQQP